MKLDIPGLCDLNFDYILYLACRCWPPDSTDQMAYEVMYQKWLYDTYGEDAWLGYIECMDDLTALKKVQDKEKVIK